MIQIYLLIDGLKLENEILKEVGSNESDLLVYQLIPQNAYMNRDPTENNFFFWLKAHDIFLKVS